MPRIQKQEDEKQSTILAIDLADGVFLDIDLDPDVHQEWLKDIYDQLSFWRNIPRPDSINNFDVSVIAVCNRYKVNSRRIEYYGTDVEKRNKNYAQAVVNRAINTVRKAAHSQQEALVNSLIGVRLLRNAFHLNEVAKCFEFRADIRSLFKDEDIQTALDNYFDNVPGEYEPQFPTINRDMPAEHLMPLSALLLQSFTIDVQLDNYARNGNGNNTKTPPPLETEGENGSMDPAGFHPSGLDNMVEDGIPFRGDSYGSGIGDDDLDSAGRMEVESGD